MSEKVSDIDQRDSRREHMHGFAVPKAMGVNAFWKRRFQRADLFGVFTNDVIYAVPACLTEASDLYYAEKYRGAANRLYYSIFHAMRAVLALDGVDMKHHSGIMSEFRRRYIKTGILEVKLSDIISVLYEMRSESDYDDFYVLSKADIAEQFLNASYFVDAIESYLKSLNILP